jgi:xanthine dehydrogenase accessory factor
MSRFIENYLAKAQELSAAQIPFVTVTLVQPEGHVPQDIGAKAIISHEGLVWGTIGGGRLEARAIDHGKSLLETSLKTQTSSQPSSPEMIRYDLQQDLGMVCGGAATLFYEVSVFSRWNIAVFGAGHVAQAVVPLLASLSCQVFCADHRLEWLDKIQSKPNLKKIHADHLPDAVASVPQDSFYVVMTQGHATDVPVIQEILKRGRPRYLGVIGSVPKSRTMRATLVESGLDRNLVDSILCPIGLAIGSNAPQEIAISIAAQLLQQRDLA